MMEDKTVAPYAQQRDLSIRPDTPLADCPTNLDLNNRHHRALIFAAGNPADYDFGTDGSLKIKATHWLVMPRQIVKPESGEVLDVATLVLFDELGMFWRTSSEFAAMRLKASLELYPPEEWAQGITFEIRRRHSKRHPGGSYHDIRILEE
jgi:hypothetical protein